MIARLLAVLLIAALPASAANKNRVGQTAASAAQATPTALAASTVARGQAARTAAAAAVAAAFPAQPASASAAVQPADGSESAVKIARALEDLRRSVPEAPESVDDVTLDPAGRAYHASPADWRDEIMYSIFVDRFARGKGGKSVGDPASGTSRHGGNLKGATAKLDYIKQSGVSTIILSPVTMSLPEAYHNYAPLHFMAVDPHFGKMADLKEFVAQAHARGLRVVLDIVINHSGPVFEYEGGPSQSGWIGMGSERKKIGDWTQPLRPVELTHPDRFTRRGVIHDWSDPGQALHGDFPPNYRHFATNEAETQRVLIKIANWWLKEADLDGFRLDAIRHVDPGFLRRFSREVKAYAASLGKDNFLLLGEDSTGRDEDLTKDLDAGMDTVYAYPEYRRTMKALHGAEPAQRLAESVQRSSGALGDAAARLVRFIDNHDTYRFLRDGEALGRLQLALAFLLLSLGIPMIYYGTEQAFRTKTGRLDPENGEHPADPENRQDMFAEGAFKTDSSAGDKFDVSSPTFKFLSALAGLRAKHAALRRGEQHVRWADSGGPGIYAFSRVHEGTEVLVVMNTADEPRAADMFVAGELNGPGTAFIDELDPAWGGASYMSEGGGSKIAVSVPPRGVRVLVRKP